MTDGEIVICNNKRCRNDLCPHCIQAAPIDGNASPGPDLRRKRNMKHECETCIWWDCGYCDKTGYETYEDDTCDKWSDEYDARDE